MDKITELKIAEFHTAIEKYNNNLIYKNFGYFIALAVIFLQICSFYYFVYLLIHSNNISFVILIVVFLASYLTTDLLNGLIHLFMDNNSHYNSLAGPLIAAFHLHHKKPRYKDKSIIKVYFHESGAKNWLPVYLTFVVYFQYNMAISIYTSFFLMCVGVLSSFAELSHYWCHNSKKDNKIISFLQQYRILLSKDHHRHHHLKDNTHYAFLNGISDPLINIIAKRFFAGYKYHADIHAKFYNDLNITN